MTDRIVVLASGRGSNFAAIADATRSGALPGFTVAALVCNKPDAPALRLARERSIPVHVLDSKSFADRAAYETELLGLLKRLSPDWICLAGYTLLLGKPLVEAWPGRILNVHPSLLPAFKGLRAQKQALDAGVAVTGCTVHLVTESLDDGPVLAQESVPVEPGDTEETLSERIRRVEHRAYVEALRKLQRQMK